MYILDAGALLNNENFSFEEENKYYTTNSIFNEWKDFRSKSLAESALSSGFMIVQDPCPISVQATFEKLEASNTKLSDADVSLVALAIEFRGRKENFVVVTDDYSIQNVLKKLRVKFVGIAQKEIKKTRIFKKPNPDQS